MSQDSAQNKDSANALQYAPLPRKRAKKWLITAGVLCGIAIVAAYRLLTPGSAPSQPPASAPTAQRPTDAELSALRLKVERQQRWQAKIQPRLKVADEACRDSIAKSIHVLTAFLEERKVGARPLAETMLTFGSKWKLVVSHLPSWLGGDGNAHRALLEQKFSEHIFTSDQMKQAVEAAVKTYLNHVQAIENELLVEIRADLADLPMEAIPEANSDAAFAKRFSKLVEDVTPQVAESLGMDVARELGTWVASEVAARIAVRVLTAVATRLGVSAGILTAGASASWATFGLSVLAAIVIDQAVGWIINWATDPVGKLETRIKEMLDETSKLVIDGEGETRGLRHELERLDQVRQRVRADAVRRIVLGE